jgi:hypothetical protein
MMLGVGFATLAPGMCARTRFLAHSCLCFFQGRRQRPRGDNGRALFGALASAVEPVLGQIPVTRLKAAHLSDLYGKLRSGQPRYVKKVKNSDGTIREKVRLGRPLGPNSVLRVHRFVHRLLGWALRHDLVNRNVADAVQAPKAAPSPAKALSADQVAVLLAAAEGKQAEVNRPSVSNCIRSSRWRLLLVCVVGSWVR